MRVILERTWREIGEIRHAMKSSQVENYCFGMEKPLHIERMQITWAIS